MNYSITVEPADKGFSVRGGCSIPSSKAPIIDAAKALKAAGASDNDLIFASGSVVSISPTSIGSILRERRPPPQAKYPGAHSSSLNA